MASVVIVNYNSTDALGECLRSVLATGLALDVLVVDNDSGDFDPEAFGEEFPQVRLLRNDANLGFAKAMNTGIRESAPCPYVAVLNPDTVVPPGQLEDLLTIADARPRAAICAPALVAPDGSVQASAYPVHYAHLTYACARQLGLGGSSLHLKAAQGGEGDAPSSLEEDCQRVGYVIGAAMLVRREAIEQVGLLDERFFLFAEDSDWCRRMRAAGWDVLYCPGVTVTHIGGASGATHGPRAVAVERHRSSGIFVRKHYGSFAAVLYRCCVAIGQLLRLAASSLLSGPEWRRRRALAPAVFWWAVSGKGGIDRPKALNGSAGNEGHHADPASA